MNKSTKPSNVTEHLANERTFLAWIRTSIGIMAFGFVLEKFALFLKQVTLFLGKPQISNSSALQGYSSYFGVTLVSFGALICILSFIKYKKSEKQINEGHFQSSMLLDLMLTLIVLAIAIFIVIYLSTSNHQAL